MSRETILAALQEKVQKGEPIIVTAAGAGLIARLEEKSGADMIVVYNSGRYRMNGIASIAGNLPIGDANQIVYEMGRDQILPMVKHTPVIAGIYGVDPTRDMRKFLLSLKELGYQAVINFPTIGKISGPIRQELEQVGLGFAKEVSSLKLAAELGFVTLAYCYNPEEAEILANAGIDIIVSHVGLTAGGDVGVKKASPLETAVEKTQAILSAAKRAKEDIIPLCHGGPIVTPEDVQHVLENTCAVGFVAASSIERLPIEKAVTDTVAALKGVNKG